MLHAISRHLRARSHEGRKATAMNVAWGRSASALLLLVGATTAAGATTTPGRVAGTLGVSSVGSAQYSIPIDVPPGTAGVVPALALQYDSSAGSGLLGVGWQLQGLGAVGRCGRSLVQDGVRAGVELSLSDRFCIDGRRLSVVSGSYGAAGSEYRTEVETFLRVQALGSAGNGPASFKAWRRDGLVMEYGSTADSRWTLPGHSTPVSWALNKVTDPHGNYYTVSYTYDAATGQQYPSRVDYTGNASATPTALAPYNSVRFSYDFGRSDIELRYVVGAKVRATTRLMNVRTYVGSTLVKDYRLTYDTSSPTARSRLKTITECAADGTTCLPPTTFAWSDDAASLSGPVIDYPSDFERWGSQVASQGTSKDYWIDLNGDGRVDQCSRVTIPAEHFEESPTYDLFCSLTQPAGAAPVNLKVATLFTAAVYFADVNGDGMLDICADSKCMLMQPSSVGASIQTPIFSSVRNYFVDVNGDGLSDHCTLNNAPANGPTSAYCSLSTGTGFAARVLLGTVLRSSKTSEWVNLAGDGVLSFCQADTAGLHCHRWTPTGFAPEISSGAISLGDRFGPGIGWADVNGDGKADFCRVTSSVDEQEDVNGNIDCTLSTGAGFGDTISATNIPVGYGKPNAIESARVWLDVNGDGKADFCRARGVITASPSPNAYMQCTLSTGSGFGQTISSPVGAWERRATIVDVTGDGRAELCYRTGSGTDSTPHCVTAPGRFPDHLIGVTDGLGAWSMMDYRPISDGAVYTKGSGASYPEVDFQDATHVVQRVVTSDGIGGSRETRYAYGGGRAHQLGRGFLGFKFRTVQAPNGVVVRAERRQDYPYTGLVSLVRATRNGVVLSDESHGYTASGLGGTRYVVYSGTSTSKSYDLNGAFRNWVETAVSNYDAYGNAQQVDTTYKTSSGALDGYSRTVATTYQNDTSNWILGLPLTNSVTSRLPGGSSSTRTSTASYFASNPGLGLVTQHIVEPNNGNQTGVSNLRLVSDFTYDVFGNPKTLVVSGANIATRTVFTNTYDARGRFQSSQNAVGRTQSATFDERFGGIVSHTDASNLTATWTYDGFGQVLTATAPDNTRVTLDRQMCVACTTNAAFVVTQTETVVGTGTNVSPESSVYFDALGRPLLQKTSAFNGQAVFKRATYDALGRLGASSMSYFASDPLRWTRYEYDDLGRLLKATSPDTTSSSVAYNGRTVTRTNHAGVTHSETFNSQGLTTSVVNAAGSADQSSVAYEYDPWGNLAKVTDALGNQTIVGHDLLGRRTQLIDPDQGARSQGYDNLGHVVSQTDAKGQTTTFAYDLLGRLTQRTAPDQTSRWYYEKNAAGVHCSNAIGKLCEATADNGYSRKYAYDSLGRLSGLLTHLDVDYVAGWTYDAAGRLDTVTFPQSTGGSPLSVRYGYNAQGWLSKVSNSATGAAYWTLNARNAHGQATSETYGNGLTALTGYDPATARLTSQQAGPAASPASVQNQAYRYDSLGRLDRREDAVAGTIELFGYDGLDRLKTAQISGPGVPGGTQLSSTSYDAIGNLKTKGGVGTYTYPATGSARPHAVTSIAGTVNGVANPSFAYDANGNLQSGAGRSYTWTSFDMPASIGKSTGTSNFLYGPEQQRIRQTWPSATAPSSTTHYLSEPHFEKEINGGLTEYKHYITLDGTSGGPILAIQTRRSDGSEDLRYVLPDHLGSTSVVSDAAGNVMERLAYDAWGDRRAANGAADPGNALQPSSTDRGFTGHEHLDKGGMGLVHMNGRVYDPTIGRFISADPFVQDPLHSQSLNRYSYLWNSPVNGTDPSGYIGIRENSLPTTGWGGGFGMDLGDVLGFAGFGIDENPPCMPSWVEIPGQMDLFTKHPNLAVLSRQGRAPSEARQDATRGAPSSSAPSEKTHRVAQAVKEFFTGPDYSQMSDEELAKRVGPDFAANREMTERCARSGACISMSQTLIDGGKIVASNIVPGEGAAVKLIAKELPAITALAGKIPNPWGRRGSPQHVARIKEAEDRLRQSGWTTVSGGSLAEKKYGNRYADLVMEREGKTIAVQVGRGNLNGTPVAREVRAMQDLRSTGEFDHVFFLRYDK